MITALEALKIIQNKKYLDEEGEEFAIELFPSLSSDEIQNLEKHLPLQKLPTEIKELLLFARGFEFLPLEEISFTDFFGLEEFFPTSVQLAGDGYGNFWILDILANGEWGNVFYVCHDPAVIVKQANNLAEFIQQLDEFAEKYANEDDLADSCINQVCEEIADSLWRKHNYFIELDKARKSSDEILKNFALQLPDNFIIADLRNQSIKSGFAWGRFGPHIEDVIRYESLHLWGMKKNK